MKSYFAVDSSDSLMHYGVKGMKWGHKKNDGSIRSAVKHSPYRHNVNAMTINSDGSGHRYYYNSSGATTIRSGNSRPKSRQKRVTGSATIRKRGTVSGGPVGRR